MILSQIEADLAFLKDGAKFANDAYTKVLRSVTSSEQSKMELAWNVIGFVIGYIKTKNCPKKLCNCGDKQNFSGSTGGICHFFVGFD